MREAARRYIRQHHRGVLAIFLAVGAVALFGCGGRDGNGGTITDEAECQDKVHDYLVDETQNHPEDFKVAPDADVPSVITDTSDEDLVAAIDRTASEVCDGLDASQELGKDEGVNIDEEQTEIRAKLFRQLSGLGL